MYIKGEKKRIIKVVQNLFTIILDEFEPPFPLYVTIIDAFGYLIFYVVEFNMVSLINVYLKHATTKYKE